MHYHIKDKTSKLINETLFNYRGKLSKLFVLQIYVVYRVTQFIYVWRFSFIAQMTPHPYLFVEHYLLILTVAV